MDSPSADVLVQAYKFCKRPGLFNSVSCEGDKIDKIFPVMAQEENKKWEVIALLSDDTGIPKNAADRLRVFDKIMDGYCSRTEVITSIFVTWNTILHIVRKHPLKLHVIEYTDLKKYLLQ